MTTIKTLSTHLIVEEKAYWSYIAQDDYRAAEKALNRIAELEEAIYQQESDPRPEFNHTRTYLWIDLAERLGLRSDFGHALAVANAAYEQIKHQDQRDIATFQLLLIQSHLNWRLGRVAAAESILSSMEKHEIVMPVLSGVRPPIKSYTLLTARYYALRAILAHDRGLHDAALRYIRFGLLLAEESAKRGHQYREANAMYSVELFNSMGQALMSAGRTAEAKQVLEGVYRGTAYQISRQSSQRSLLLSLAKLDILRGDYKSSRAFLDQALILLKGETHQARRMLHASYYHFLSGLLEESRGMTWDAVIDYMHAIEVFNIDRSEPTRPSPIVSARFHAALARAQLESRQYAQSVKSLMTSHRLLLGWLLQELPLQPRELRNSQLAAVPDAVSTTFALLDVYPGAMELALQTRLNRQGLLAEIEKRQRQLANSSVQTRDLAEQIAGIDQQLASVSLDPERRPTLQMDRLRLEEQLYQALPGLRIEPVSTKEVAAAIPRDGLLVEFQKYRPFLGFQKGDAQWGEPRYLALLLHHDGRTGIVPLGEAAGEQGIDSMVGQALKANAENLADAQDLMRLLSRRVIGPLQPHLSGIGELFLSPDGELHRIPFAALPSPQDPQRLLSEQVQLRILTTGRDLVPLQQPPRVGEDPVVMANPAYDVAFGAALTTTTATAVSKGTPRTQLRSSVLRAGQRWDPLPATEREGREVARLLGIKTPITGSQANALWLQQQSSPRILHIASHGFFFPVQLPEARSGLGELILEPGFSTPVLPAVAALEDPLLRSGIVLAGADHPDANPADDGYLTAAEAAGLQLQDTELVVLSACETAQGDIKANTGEGVYGLQRGLAVAGARSTLLSLWKVDDAATASFMTAYYGRLRQGKGRADALVDTQADFRQGRIQDPEKRSDWREPAFWAAWQLSGDWRPIRGI